MVGEAAKISAQCFSELLNVAQKKQPVMLPKVRELISMLDRSCTTVEPAVCDRLNASILAETRKIQFYDAQLITTLVRAGVRLLLSEDLTNDETYDGLTILNPFNPANIERIASAQ